MLCIHCKQNERIGSGNRCCLSCHRAKKARQSSARRKRQREQRATLGTKDNRCVCCMCGYVKCLSEFSTSLPNGKGKRNKTCDKCLTKIYTSPARYSADNSLSLAFWRKKAYTANTVARVRLAKEKGLAVSEVKLTDLSYICKPQHLAKLYREQEGRCNYCRVSLDTPLTVAIDHVNPISRNGGHSLKNLAFACKDCNHLKHTRNAQEFLQFLKEYVQRFISDRTAE